MSGLSRDMNPSLERSVGRAAVLGIGTANPPHVVEQSTFPDYYFKITNSEHMAHLKEKFTRICEKSKIAKRYTVLTDEFLIANPTLTSFNAPSLDTRQQLLDVEVPRLGAEAATRAIKDWGRPMSDLTHLIFCNSYGASIPGADYELVKLLGLPLSTRRVMLYQQCCYAGGTVIRLAKDLAENNRDARVLVVCCELNTVGIRGPCQSHLEDLVSQALFGDGAGALIIGADPRAGVERSIFEIVRTSQNIIAGSEGALVAKLREVGLVGRLKPEIPMHLSCSIEKLASEALNPVGIADWNEAFWVMHPGGRAILDELEKKLGLGEEKLAATREVLRDYGNMSSTSVLFVMEVMRRRSEERGLATAGEGLEWGVLLGFGPGLTMETVVLRCP